MADPAVVVDGLVVRYGDVTAVAGASFSAERGRVLALLGPNGAGKTSTVETIEGYRRPATGEVRVLGLDPVDDHRRLVARVGVMLQEGGVYPTMSARRALRLFASYYDDPVDPDELITRLGLTGVAETGWRRLSGGERRRLSLALALIGRPQVVLLDEPTAGVDPEGRAVVRQAIQDLRSEGAAVIVTTHELGEADRLADDVVVLHRGRVAVAGTIESLRQQAGGAIRFRADAGIDTAAMSAALGADVSAPASDEYVVGAAPSPELVAAVTAWLAANGHVVDDLRTGVSLEDVFLDAIAEKEQEA